MLPRFAHAWFKRIFMTILLFTFPSLCDILIRAYVLGINQQ